MFWRRYYAFLYDKYALWYSKQLNIINRHSVYTFSYSIKNYNRIQMGKCIVIRRWVIIYNNKIQFQCRTSSVGIYLRSTEMQHHHSWPVSNSRKSHKNGFGTCLKIICLYKSAHCTAIKKNHGMRITFELPTVSRLHGAKVFKSASRVFQYIYFATLTTYYNDVAVSLTCRKTQPTPTVWEHNRTNYCPARRFRVPAGF